MLPPAMQALPEETMPELLLELTQIPHCAVILELPDATNALLALGAIAKMHPLPLPGTPTARAKTGTVVRPKANKLAMILKHG
jgi:hypothetical protein